EAIKIIHQLVKEHDVVLEQFRPGVMDRLGLGYATLKKINPKLIYCAITGYGQTGPYKSRAGHDLNYLALAGISSYSRRANQAPVPLGVQVADVAGGSLHSVIGILAALHHRDKTGEGQFIDISMTDTAFALNAMSGAGQVAGNMLPDAETELLNGGSFYDYYETKDGRYFSVGSLEPKFFFGLCDLIGHPELKELSHGTDSSLKDRLKVVFKDKTFSEWKDIFATKDLCVEPVLNIQEACEHPQLRSREMIVKVPTEKGEAQKQIGCPIKFSSSKATYLRTGGKIGSHSEEILKELGLEQQEIEALAHNKIVKL
ncbi:CaiB/BaiF CoA-transferase family protein, partial [Neptuniibacter sp.]|uniref:CaiB/BaiF CoA transferase family protein n=1 Tax=Neptuniibacter sp. TaxID=1962643 RepID=UPI00260AF9A0